MFPKFIKSLFKVPDVSADITISGKLFHIHRVRKIRDRQYSGRNFDKFRQLFIIFSTNHPCDGKIVKCPINTSTTLLSDDVIATSVKKMPFSGPFPEKKGPTVYFGRYFDKFKYIVVFFLQGLL